MIALILATFFTLSVSGFCSLLEAFILSTTTAEIEAFKKSFPKRGHLLEKFKTEIEETSSAILTLNTIANTLGATLVGAIAAQHYGDLWVGIISGSLVLGILIFSEVIPKNLGVIYRTSLQKHLVYPLQTVRITMVPLSCLCRFSVYLVIRKKPVVTTEEQEQEIKLLAEKHAKEGSLTTNERDMIHNALSLDDVQVSTIMTPRTVVTTLESDLTIEEIFQAAKTVPFARIPVYKETVDDIVGLVRRRDLLQALADDEHKKTVAQLMHDATFVPDTATAADALQQFLKSHQPFAVVVDEFGSTAGVVTMEDIVEHILGREIYEETDVAVDMRELARDQAEKNKVAERSLSSDTDRKEHNQASGTIP